MMSRRTVRRVAFAVAGLLALQAATPAWAWGRLGHRVIAKLAERHLTDEAKAGIKALLEPGESLADASTWADEHRRQLPRTAAWHYVDVPMAGIPAAPFRAATAWRYAGAPVLANT